MRSIAKLFGRSPFVPIQALSTFAASRIRTRLTELARPLRVDGLIALTVLLQQSIRLGLGFCTRSREHDQ